MLVPALALALSAASAGAPAPAAHPDAAALRAALMRELRVVPGDGIGAAAAAWLESGKFVIAPAEKKLASYSAATRTIALSERAALEMGGGQDPAAFARRAAAAFVHEAQHAADLRESRGAPKSLEAELSAYAAEVVFLRRRLARDPDFAGLKGMDDLVRARLKVPAPAGDWWRVPFPPGRVREYLKAGEDRARVESWSLVRAGADGLPSLEKGLKEFGFLPFPPIDEACARETSVARFRSCRSLAGLLKRRLARFAALLQDDPLVR